jgi:hypothetical protein
MTDAKTQKLTEEQETIKEFSDAINEQQSSSIRAKLVSLYKNQQARDSLLEKGYNEEFYSLEYKYNLLYAELNKKVTDIVNENTPIPNYWKVAIENAKFFPINDKDKEILKYLTNIEIKHNDTDKKSFTVLFYFNQNSFFDHNVLEKAYKFDKKEDAYTEMKATEIKWKGEAPNIKIVKKKVKKGKNVSTVTKEKKVESFFNIFEENEEEEDEEKSEEEEGKPDLSSEADFIQNDLVPFSMEYYLDLQKLSAIDDHVDEEVEEEEEEHDKKKKRKHQH